MKLPNLAAALVVTASLIASAACGGGSSSRTLDRATALAILRNQESALLSSLPMEFARVPYWIPGSGATAQELAGTVPFTLSPVSRITAAVKTNSELADYGRALETRWLVGHFDLALSREGALKLAAVSNETHQIGAMGISGPSLVGVQLDFRPVAVPGLDVTWSNTDAWHLHGIAVPLISHFTAVTGITGEGDLKQVEASVLSTASPTLQRLREIARRVVREQTGDPDAYAAHCTEGYDYVCNLLRFTVPPIKTQRFLFRRFDDGWRLQQ